MTQRHNSEEMTMNPKENKPGGGEIVKVVLKYASESTAIKCKGDSHVLCPRVS